MKKSIISKIAVMAVLLTAAASFVSCGKEDKYKNDTHLAIEDGKTVVERYGNLQVIGTDICDQNGNPVQLRGMSSHGLQWYGKFANDDVITWLRDDWNCQLWRAALYTVQGGYIGNPVLGEKMITSIESCIKNGMYILVDWHVIGEKDPLLYKEQAIEFFTDISKTYGDKANIIYEICNEPNGENVTWKDNIKPYAEEVIAAIRANDPDNIIVVGTPIWSSNLAAALEDPITKYKNIMYTYHFYAGSHGKESRKGVQKAIDAGLPVFITEWGCTKASGDGGVFEEETLEWVKFMKKNNISWANWSVNNKGEDSGVLAYNKDRDAKGHWKDSDLSKAGKFLRQILRNEIK